MGNVDSRFSADAIANRNKILSELGVQNTAWMKAQGESEFVDLTQDNTVGKWSEYAVDAIVSRSDNKLALALFPADCIPLIMHFPESKLLLFAHVGRRNAEDGIVAKLCAYVRKTYGAMIADAKVYIGPSIRQESYFFKTIDKKQLEDTRWRNRIQRADDLYYVDLLGFTIDRLLDEGVESAAITTDNIDTGSDKNYFSHARAVRTGKPEGRNMFIVKPLET